MKQFRVRQEQHFGEIWLDRTLPHEEELTLQDDPTSNPQETPQEVP